MNRISSFPTLVKRDAPSPIANGWGASDIDAGMPIKSIETRKLEDGNTFITICAAPEGARNGDYYD